MSASRELPVPALYRSCDLRQLDFETTNDLAELDHLVAQERAANAIEFGASIQHEGYNLFVLGREGTGRHSLLQQYLERKARREPPASDWCYLNNFEESRQPRAIGLPAGRGRKLAADMTQLIDDARAAIPAAFESEDYRTRRESIERELAEEQEAAFEAVSKSEASESSKPLRALHLRPFARRRRSIRKSSTSCQRPSACGSFATLRKSARSCKR